MPNLEGIVEEFEKKWYDPGDDRYGLIKHNNTILQQQIDWLRSALERAREIGKEEGNVERGESMIKVGHKTGLMKALLVMPMVEQGGSLDLLYNLALKDWKQAIEEELNK